MQVLLWLALSVVAPQEPPLHEKDPAAARTPIRVVAPESNEFNLSALTLAAGWRAFHAFPSDLRNETQRFGVVETYEVGRYSFDGFCPRLGLESSWVTVWLSGGWETWDHVEGTVTVTNGNLSQTADAAFRGQTSWVHLEAGREVAGFAAGGFSVGAGVAVGLVYLHEEFDQVKSSGQTVDVKGQTREWLGTAAVQVAGRVTLGAQWLLTVDVDAQVVFQHGYAFGGFIGAGYRF